MAESTAEKTEKPLPAEDWQKQIASQTTFTRYSLNLLKSIGITLAGAVAGGASFFALKNTKFIENATQKLLRFFSLISSQTAITNVTRIQQVQKNLSLAVGAVTGALFGFLTSRLINGYKSWKTNEIEIQTVQQVNKDIATIKKERGTFAETLNRQEKTIQQMEQHLGIGTSPARLEQASASPLAGGQQMQVE